MKRLLKKIFLVPLIGTTIIFTNISANKSNWSGMNLSNEEINNSIYFQLQRGGNCIGEFKKLQPVLDRFITQKVDVAYLNNYLGKPNKTALTNGETQYQYLLTEKSNGYKVNFIAKNYGIVSYKIENCNNPLNSIAK